jgi:hypothetical protein
VLVGAGIMSATLAAILKELQPNLKIAIFEKLESAAQESSNAWNNAGTGHAALCELNYTPQQSDGSIDISKALEVNGDCVRLCPEPSPQSRSMPADFAGRGHWLNGRYCGRVTPSSGRSLVAERRSLPKFSNKEGWVSLGNCNVVSLWICRKLD